MLPFIAADSLLLSEQALCFFYGIRHALFQNIAGIFQTVVHRFWNSGAIVSQTGRAGAQIGLALFNIG